MTVPQDYCLILCAPCKSHRTQQKVCSFAGRQWPRGTMPTVIHKIKLAVLLSVIDNRNCFYLTYVIYCIFIVLNCILFVFYCIVFVIQCNLFYLTFQISEVIVNEDCSIPKEEQGVAGKRGLTGIIFVMKIAGALAEQGLSLEEVTKTANDVLQNIATYSVGLTACAIPGQYPNITYTRCNWNKLFCYILNHKFYILIYFTIITPILPLLVTTS